MLDDRTITLINAELDNELSDAERAELDVILRDSADARTLRSELMTLGELMDRAPEQEPPAGLAAQILESVSLAKSEVRTQKTFSLARVMASLQPLQVGMAFAAGLFVAVGYYELSGPGLVHSDSAQMVGTMVAGKRVGTDANANSLLFKEAGINGTVTLRKNGPYRILDFDIDSGDSAEVEIAFAEAGLSFGGIARTSDSPEMPGQSYEITGGTLRVVNEGRQAFSVFLRQAAGDDTSREGISIGISSGGQQHVSGVIRG